MSTLRLVLSKECSLVSTKECSLVIPLLCLFLSFQRGRTNFFILASPLFLHPLLSQTLHCLLSKTPLSLLQIFSLTKMANIRRQFLHLPKAMKSRLENTFLRSVMIR